MGSSELLCIDLSKLQAMHASEYKAEWLVLNAIQFCLISLLKIHYKIFDPKIACLVMCDTFWQNHLKWGHFQKNKILLFLHSLLIFWYFDTFKIIYDLLEFGRKWSSYVCSNCSSLPKQFWEKASSKTKPPRNHTIHPTQV